MGKRTAVSLHAFPGCLGCILTLLPCSRILTIGGGKSSNMLHSNFQSVSIGENGEVYWWPSLSRLETIASGLEAIAPRVEAIASRLECLFLEEYSLLSWHWADAPNPCPPPVQRHPLHRAGSSSVSSQWWLETVGRLECYLGNPGEDAPAQSFDVF